MKMMIIDHANDSEETVQELFWWSDGEAMVGDHLYSLRLNNL